MTIFIMGWGKLQLDLELLMCQGFYNSRDDRKQGKIEVGNDMQQRSLSKGVLGIKFYLENMNQHNM